MHVFLVFGTRPEAIKMAPVILELKKRGVKTTVCFSGQHVDLVKDVIDFFNLEIDLALDVMRNDQALPELVSKILLELNNILVEAKPDLVLVHGDTATTLAASLAAFMNKIKLGHVEAGLRTYNLSSPWPEEGNRVITGVLSDLHFTPTETTYQNLISEGKNPNTVFVTGNTVIDSIKIAGSMVRGGQQLAHSELKTILVTCHRRENFNNLDSICCALLKILELHGDVQIILPVHPNPNVSKKIYSYLGNHERIKLVAPQPYGTFVRQLEECFLVVTDSGGLQEEAPALNKPVLVIRDTTERPEVIRTGAALLIGTEQENIVEAVNTVLTDFDVYHNMSNAENPYGDGSAADKIVDICENFLKGEVK